jgi:hypothetical protein
MILEQNVKRLQKGFERTIERKFSPREETSKQEKKKKTHQQKFRLLIKDLRKKL